MSYVDAGYAIALVGILLYAVSLVLRRRRWEKALRMSRPTEHPLPPASTAGDGARSGGPNGAPGRGNRP